MTRPSPPTMPATKNRAFVRYAVVVLVVNLGVVLWGALVRATGSGAGCGSHWPLCNGVVVPLQPAEDTLIEFGHRVLSALALVGVLVLWGWAIRRFPPGDLVRRWAWAALGLIVVEALVGAGLVLMRWVADDASAGRAVSIAIHLIITYALLASLALVGWHASGRRGTGEAGRIGAGVAVLLVGGMVLVGATGAITALGDTLFPSPTLAEGWTQDLSSQAHFLVRLRVIHPMAAVLVACGVLGWAEVRRRRRVDRVERRWLEVLRWLIVVQLGAGLVNLVLLAPVWTQIVHLLLADLAWLAMVLCLALAGVVVPSRREPPSGESLRVAA